MTKTPPPLTKGDDGQGEPRNRFGSRAIKMVQNGELMPYWEVFTGHHYTREALTRWGVAEFKQIRLITRKGAARWMCRLTEKGIKARDDYARMKAERASKRRHGE